MVSITLDLTIENILKYVVGPIAVPLISCGITIGLFMALTPKSRNPSGDKMTGAGVAVMLLTGCAVIGLFSSATYAYYFGLSTLITPTILFGGYWGLLRTGILR